MHRSTGVYSFLHVSRQVAPDTTEEGLAAPAPVATVDSPWPRYCTSSTPTTPCTRLCSHLAPLALSRHGSTYRPFHRPLSTCRRSALPCWLRLRIWHMKGATTHPSSHARPQMHLMLPVVYVNRPSISRGKVTAVLRVLGVVVAAHGC
jgi:hypothetical protein